MSGKFALVFGNTQYADPALAQLTAPGQDAQDLARVLRDPALCSFDEVTVCLNERSSAAIEAIDSFFDARKPDDLLVLYFSGHGLRDELGSLYLAFSNTVRTRLRSTALKAEYVREAMDESRSKRQVLILDCCNSGAFPAGAKAELGGAMGLANALQGYGRYVLTASDATQFAWEGDRLIGSTANSLFTHFLVKGLEGDADRDGDGTISVDDLYDYAFDQISRLTPNQTPTKSAARQEGEIILRRITRLEDIKPISLPDGLLEAIDDSRTFVREGAVEQLARLLAGKNLGLARSAQEALEKMRDEDDSLRVRKAASDALAPILAAEQEAELAAQQQKEAEQVAAAQAEAERLATVKAQQEQAARQKAEADRLARIQAEADRRAQQQAEKERLAQQQAEKERLAQQKAEAKRLAEQKRQEQRAREQATSAQPNLRPRWISAVWFALAFATGPILLPLLQPNVYVGDALFGATAGLVAAFGLYREQVLRRRLSLLWIALGWAAARTTFRLILEAGGVNLILIAAIAGALAGVVFALVLRSEKVLPNRMSLLWLTLIWVIARAVSQALFQGIVVPLADSGVPLPIPDTIVSALGGGLGGVAIIWLIRQVNAGVESGPVAPVKIQEEQREPLAAEASPALRSLWLPVLLFGLGYAAGAILWPLVHPELRGGYIFFGALSGLIIAIVLYSQRLLKQWTSVLFVTVAWGLIGGIYAAILIATDYSADQLSMGVAAGLLEGFILGFLLYREKTLSRPLSILWITLLWAITELAVGGAIQATDVISLDDSIHSLIHIVVLFVLGVGAGFAMLLFAEQDARLKVAPAFERTGGGTELHPPLSFILHRSVLWAVTGCALAGGILARTAEWSGNPGRRQAVAVLGSSGLCIGFFIALMLLAERRVRRRRSLLAIVFGWAGMWALIALYATSIWYEISMIGSLTLLVLTWALGGLVTGVVLRDEQALPSWGSVGLVTLACAIGGLASTLIMEVLGNGGISSGNALLPFAFVGALSGAIIGAGMIWQLRRGI